MKISVTIKILILIIFVNILSTTKVTAQDNKVYTTPDKMPIFPGGKIALVKFIKDNLKYPEEAKAANYKGKVTVSFIVEKKGTVSSVEVIKGIGKGCDEEAMRIVRKMPVWIPGTTGGKQVRVLYKLYIAFPPE